MLLDNGVYIVKATIFDIERNSYVDGPGIRTTVFFKGCNLKCKWCHNPESQNSQKEILFYRSKCTGCERCKDLTVDSKSFLCLNDAKEICGKEYTVDEVLKEVLKDKTYYETSGGGVTFSGGECLLQNDFLTAMLKKCKEAGIHTAVDTAGNVPWNKLKQILPYTDMFLYDIKCISENLHIDGTGVTNRLILENLEKLSKEFSGEVIIRIPVIGGFNDNEEEMKKISEFLTRLHLKQVELLPYHAMGEHKYEALGKVCQKYSVPSAKQMEKYHQLFSSVTVQ